MNAQPKERPIIFSAPMVRAERAGIKTMTRRMRGLEKINANPSRYVLKWLENDFHPLAHAIFRDVGTGEQTSVKCPYGRVADYLWIRESGVIFKKAGMFRHDVPATDETGFFWIEKTRAAGASYSVAGCLRNSALAGPGAKACPSIHMPRWASRTLLEITDIRLERLQSISKEDAIAEGCGLYVDGHGFITETDLRCDPGYSNFLNPRGGFEQIWIEINGHDSWEASPWVWIISFRRIDQAAAEKAA